MTPEVDKSVGAVAPSTPDRISPQTQSEHDRAMVGHAVAHLSNMLPRFGVRYSIDSPLTVLSEPLTDDVPRSIVQAAADATFQVARYLEEVFRRERGRLGANVAPLQSEGVELHKPEPETCQP